MSKHGQMVLSATAWRAPIPQWFLSTWMLQASPQAQKHSFALPFFVFWSVTAPPPSPPQQTLMLCQWTFTVNTYVWALLRTSFSPHTRTHLYKSARTHPRTLLPYSRTHINGSDEVTQVNTNLNVLTFTAAWLFCFCRIVLHNRADNELFVFKWNSISNLSDVAFPTVAKI